jgi:hypothetical protein
VGFPSCADSQPIIGAVADVAGQDILVTAAERYSVLRRFPTPIFANLVEVDGGYALVWSR